MDLGLSSLNEDPVKLPVARGLIKPPILFDELGVYTGFSVDDVSMSRNFLVAAWKEGLINVSD